MTWNPRRAIPPMPSRLAVYANRVAEISRDRQPVGFVLVQPEPCAMQVGGALWWRRWSEFRWAAHLWITFPDFGLDGEQPRMAWSERVSDFRATDTIVSPEDLDAELDDWDANRFMFVGEQLALRWLDADESARVALAEWGEWPGAT